MDIRPHPSLDLFEGFVKKIVDQVQASPYANDTAIFITFDEGGGYYDSGYVQPLDYFGDGTRIPLLVVSKYVTPGHISHRLRGSRVDSEVHRAQLGAGTGDEPQSGQFPEPHRSVSQSLCAAEYSGAG